MAVSESWWKWLVAAGLLLPLVALLLSLYPFPDAAVDGDSALLELGVRLTWSGENLLGPYSRFRFHHPGPLYFFLMQPVYRLTGESHAGMLATAVLVNLAAVAVLLLVVRGWGPWLLTAACALIGLLLLRLGPAKLFSAWNPDLPVLPFAAALFCLAAAVAGRTHYLPAALAVLTLAVQSSLAFAPTSVLLVVAALLCLVLPRLVGRTGERGAGWKILVVAAALLGLLWGPVLYQEVTAEDGNLTRIVSFFSLPHSRHTLAAGWTAVAPRLTGFLFGGWTPGASISPWLSALLVAGLIWGFARARRRDPLVASLALFALMGLAAAVWSASRIVGEIHDHLVGWVAGVGLVGMIAVIAAFVPRRPPRSRRLRHLWFVLPAVPFLGVCLLNFQQGWQPGRLKQWPEHPEHRTIEELARETEQALGRNLALLEARLATAGVWPEAAGVLLRLHKSGMRSCVQRDWLFMFGGGLACREPAPALLLFGDARFGSRAAGDPRFTPAGASSQTWIFLAAGQEPPDVIDFSAHDSMLYLRSGFVESHSVERGRGRWSYGPSSEVDLPLAPARPHQLEIVARPLPLPGRTQTLRVSLNGREVATFPLVERELPYIVSLPAGQVRAVNRLRFDYGYAEPPILHLPDSDDWRPLGVFFRRLRVVGGS